MKKALLGTTVLMLFAFVAEAQISKGKILLGGTLGYSTGSSEADYPLPSPPYDKQHFVTISPSVGKVIKDNLVLGIVGSYFTGLQRSQNQSNETEWKTDGYGGAVFLRRYISLTKNFYFFGQGAAGYSVNKQTQTTNKQLITESKNGLANLALLPGLSYAVTPKFFVEANLNNLALITYNHSIFRSFNPNTNIIETSKGNSFSVSTSLSGTTQFSIGFKVLL